LLLSHSKRDHSVRDHSKHDGVARRRSRVRGWTIRAEIARRLAHLRLPPAVDPSGSSDPSDPSGSSDPSLSSDPSDSFGDRVPGRAPGRLLAGAVRRVLAPILSFSLALGAHPGAAAPLTAPSSTPPAVPPAPCLAERFVPASPAAGARFGAAVAIDAAGRFAIGVPGRDEVRVGSVDPRTGVARCSGTLRGAAGSRFGAAIALSEGRLAVGAPDAAPAGAAFLFDLDGPGAPPLELRPAAASAGARAGSAVALAADLVLLGAPDHGSTSAPTGAVFRFARSGAQWDEVAPLFPFDGGTEGGFGEAVALDGERIAVGAPRAAGARGESGAVYLFARAVGAAPAAIARIELADGVADEAFGAAVVFIGGDLAIGVPYRDAAAPAAGAIAIVGGARLAAAASSASHGRIAPDLLLARASSPVAAALGSSLCAFGPRLAAGAPADGGGAPLAGAVAIFSRDPSAADPLRFREDGVIHPEPLSPGCELGRAVAIAASAGASGETVFLLAGAPGDPERCGGAFGCDAGSAQLAIVAGGADCDGDGAPDACALRADPSLDADGDGTLDRCRFRRGDLDRDGALTLADPVLWLTAPPPGGDCPAAADANGDGALDLADPVTLLEHLFQSAPAPPPPFPGCGTEEPGALGCAGDGCEG